MPPNFPAPTAKPVAPSVGLVDQFGRVIPSTTDPAWQPPTDPLRSGNVQQTASVIHREIPISVVSTGWDVPAVRSARSQLVIGLFEQPAAMIDAIILSDSRVQSGLSSRLSILGRPVSFRTPRRYRDSDLANECREAFEDVWESIATEAVIGELQRWGIMLGFGPGQILWDMSGKYATPHPLPWHPRYTYYHWLYRCYVAITLDGQEPIIPGDGSWILHAPFGAYRGWMRGAVGPISPWWLGRAYALRDWMRYSERHGLPMIKLKTPAVGDPYQQASMRFQVANLGQETVFHLPQNPPPALSYDVELMEAKDTAHEGFRMLIEQCNQEITLALLAQTLTSSMPAEGGSSYAAARVHAGVLQGLMEGDARSLAWTVYTQIARPFAALNFGDPDLAPRVVWDVTPFEDAKTKAIALLDIAESFNFMRLAGFKIDPRDARRLINRTIPGMRIGKLTAIEPLAVQVAGEQGNVKVAKSGAARDHHAVVPEGRGRIVSLMGRIDPRIAERAQAAQARFFAGEDEGLREARAEMEQAAEEQRRARRRTH